MCPACPESPRQVGSSRVRTMPSRWLFLKAAILWKLLKEDSGDCPPYTYQAVDDLHNWVELCRGPAQKFLCHAVFLGFMGRSESRLCWALSCRIQTFKDLAAQRLQASPKRLQKEGTRQEGLDFADEILIFRLCRQLRDPHCFSSSVLKIPQSWL